MPIAISRETRGQLGYVFLLILLLSAFFLVALASDQSHMQAVRSELQNATDAAALAGAADLWTNVDQAESDAILWAGKNSVDGSPLTAGPDRSLSVVVTRPDGNTPGSVAVTSSVTVRHLFSKVFSRWSDVIAVTSVAGTSGQLWMLSQNQAFPFAASLDTIPSTKDWIGEPLSSYQAGDTVTFSFASQGTKNAAWTSFTISPASGKYIDSAIEQALGLQKPQPGFIPSMKIGDTIHLNNGIVGEKTLAKDPEFSALTQLPYIVVPIFRGEPPYNQTAKIIGFAGLKVTDVELDASHQQLLTISGTLVNPQVEGTTGPFPTRGDPIDPAVTRLAPGPIQLIH